MKKTPYIKKIWKENIHFNIIKFKSWMGKAFPFPRKIHDARKKSYTALFSDTIQEKYRRDNSFPDNIYYKPTGILLYDIILKQDLGQLRKGIISLLQKNLSNKYISSTRTKEDIDEIIENLNSNITSSKTWHRIGIFDFERDPSLRKYIDHFEVRLRNFSSSYMAIEIIIKINCAFENELGNFIHANYVKPGMKVYKTWQASSHKGRSKVSYAIGPGNTNEFAKYTIINEQLQMVKQLFLDKIIKYFPLFQASNKIPLCGINIMETNIDVEKTSELSIYSIDSLGLDESSGFFLSKAERFYYATSKRWINRSNLTDMVFLFNPNKITEYDGFMSPQYAAFYNLTNEYMSYLYPIIITRGLCSYYTQQISKIRNLANSTKAKKSSYKRLLKLKYKIQNTFYTYYKIDQEMPLGDELKYISKKLNQNDFARRSMYERHHAIDLFVFEIDFLWKTVQENYQELLIDINNKIEIATSLKDYTDARWSSWRDWSQLALAVGTFILLIFPAKSQILASIIKKILQFLIDIIEPLLNFVSGYHI